MATARRRVLGLLFIVVLVVFIGITVAQYNKAFTPVVKVDLLTDSVGNALPAHADVKLRGIVVGEVRSVTANATGDTVTAHLALDPSKTDLIPTDTTARILPKTLFGERYVSLMTPDGDSKATVRAGDVLQQDRSGNAIEVSRVLDGLLPVLQAVPPQQLQATLGAIATAIGGRGADLGTTITQLNNITGQLADKMPALRHDLTGLADFAQTYSQAAPDLVDALDNLNVTTNTIKSQKTQFEALLTSLTSTSGETADLLAKNHDSIISIAADSREALQILAEYSPAFGCTMANFVKVMDVADPILGVGSKNPGVRVTIELTNPRGRYLPNQDEPRFFDTRGPACYEQFPVGQNFPQYPGGAPNDGSYQPPSRNAGPEVYPTLPAPQYSVVPASDGTATLSTAGSVTEADTLRAVYSQATGIPATDVPLWSAMIAAPAFRGAQVSVR